MDNKYLPLGSICKIKNNDFLVMIVGYYSIKYNDNLTIFDYKGCKYPEGLLLDRTLSFNHSDIINIIYKGYVDDSYNELNKILVTQQGTINSNKNTTLKNFQFDENGVVIYDPYDDKKNDSKENNDIKKNIFNPFYSNYTDKQEERKTTSDSPIFKKIVFDENGVVISAEEN